MPIQQRAYFGPEKARWDHIAQHAKLPEIGQIVDTALDTIEKENHTLKGVLPKNFIRPNWTSVF